MNPIIDILKNIDGYVYLASPYSHEENIVMESRFKDAERALVWLLKQGIPTYGAIAYTHNLVAYGFPVDFEFWSKIDKPFIEKANVLIVLTLQGWTTSKGISKELQIAHKLRTPVFTMREEKTNEYVLSKH